MTSFRKHAVHRWNGSTFEMSKDVLADESVIQLHVNDEHITTLLGTNSDLESLIRGHMATQYNVSMLDEQSSIVVESRNGVQFVNLQSPGLVVGKKRTEPVTTSCGACDLDDLADILGQTPLVDPPPHPLNMDHILNTIDALGSDQPLFAQTGGVHAAGLMFPNNEDILIMEDIGRHNAVDKVIGQHLIRKSTQRPSALLLSGRCGWGHCCQSGTRKHSAHCFHRGRIGFGSKGCSSNWYDALYVLAFGKIHGNWHGSWPL